ncbi:MAG: hypothetical protein AB9Q22_04450 [Candidatus Reddybacter sp.]
MSRKIMLIKALHLFSPVLLVVLLLGATSGFAGDPRVRLLEDSLSSINTGSELESYTFSTRKGEVKSAIQCLGGYKFAVVSSVGHKAAPQPAVSIIQVYEDLKGRVVPARC